MNGLFITSTGTGIGKTLITAALAYQCRIHHRQVMAIKPVISGMDQGFETSDTAILAQSLGRPLSQAVIETISPFRFEAPLAPLAASLRENNPLDYDKLLQTCFETLNAFDFTVIEGVGGAFVPLTETRLVADWITDLKLDSILVVGSYLGTLSHTIATFEAMQARGLTIKAIIVSQSEVEFDASCQNSNSVPDLTETASTIQDLTRIRTVTVPFQSGPRPWQHLPNLINFTGL